jgi:hypothetical protein
VKNSFSLILCVGAILLAVIGCGERIIEMGDNQDTTWPLRDDMMNLAILLVDYQSYEFEEGNLSFYPPCESCDADSLPFLVIFSDTWDYFANISFLYTETGDTLFYATVIWDGQGEIHYPDEFLLANSFKTKTSPAQEPVSIQYFSIYPDMPESTFHQKADSAWTAVINLDIVHDFAREDYRTGIYLYPPSVGVFLPEVARWVVFLYRGKD